ncbi:MAG TPA: endo-1,4-beta-xylanase [Chryseosolibacter sp.]
MRKLEMTTAIAAACVALMLAAFTFDGGRSGNKSLSLKDAFDGKFLMGVAMNRSQIYRRDEADYWLIIDQFNSVTPENDMKWMHIHPEKEQYNFEHADKLVEFGEANHMFIVGHALVWHNQLAPWVFKTDDGATVDSTELMQRIRDHIRTIVGRYKGRVHGWDVVNEALAEDGSLRQSQFLAIAGPRFIEKAFEFAHEADPDAGLYYNDFNLVTAAKRDGAIRLIRDLKNKGIKVDGVGMQAHWGLTRPSLQEIETAIEMFSALGVNVMFTELDISVLPSPRQVQTADVSNRLRNTPAMDPYVDGLPDSVQHQLAARYASIFRLFKKHADKISRVTFWGLHDGVSWKNNFPVRGRTDYALLFDRDRKPKEAYHAVIEASKE